jgi:hypothetical protein
VVRDDMTIPDISAEQLRPVVGRALGSPDATPLAWSCEPLGAELVNPITAGLYRVAGTAQVGAAHVRPWRVILKVSHRPDFTGTPLEHGYAEHPTDWNYWRREVLAYSSGIPERFSSPLRPVRCWSVEDVDDRTAWLWLGGPGSHNRRTSLVARRPGPLGVRLGCVLGTGCPPYR